MHKAAGCAVYQSRVEVRHHDQKHATEFVQPLTFGVSPVNLSSRGSRARIMRSSSIMDVARRADCSDCARHCQLLQICLPRNRRRFFGRRFIYRPIRSYFAPTIMYGRCGSTPPQNQREQLARARGCFFEPVSVIGRAAKSAPVVGGTG